MKLTTYKLTQVTEFRLPKLFKLYVSFLCWEHGKRGLSTDTYPHYICEGAD